MKKAFLLVIILFVSVISTACINNLAVQQLNNKAKSYLDKGDYDNAINRLKASIDLDNTIFETHYNLGIAYTQAEKYPEALDTFQNAIKLKPNFSDTYYSLAVAQENYANAIIQGSLSKDNKTNATTEQSKEEEVAPSNRTLTTAEKSQVTQLINDSITSYTTYLQKSSSAKDKQDVEQKIEQLKSQLTKYSTNNQP